MRINFLSTLCLVSIFLVACDSAFQSGDKLLNLTDRERDGLVGPVKAVLTDDVILSESGGQQIEIQQASSVSIYDETGKRILQTPFRIAIPGGYAIAQHDPMFNPQARGQKIEEPASNRGGKWIKNYDGKGRMVEGVRYDASGKQAESLSVSYEFDAPGNWIKRVTLRANQGGQSPSQITEVSYRHIVYFGSAATPGVSKAEFIPANASQMKSPIAASEENIARGRALFNQKCAACHGENGKSQTEFAAVMPVRPKDLTGETVRSLSDGEIYSVISGGLEPSGMPAFKNRVSDEALWQIALYVRQLSRNPTGTINTPSAVAAASPKPPQPTSETVAEQRYQLKGKVVSVERELRQVTIEHEEIKGYMGAMTMPFPLADGKTLERIRKNDLIEATLVVSGSGWRLENVVIK